MVSLSFIVPVILIAAGTVVICAAGANLYLLAKGLRHYGKGTERASSEGQQAERPHRSGRYPHNRQERDERALRDRAGHHPPVPEEEPSLLGADQSQDTPPSLSPPPSPVLPANPDTFWVNGIY